MFRERSQRKGQQMNEGKLLTLAEVFDGLRKKYDCPNDLPCTECLSAEGCREEAHGFMQGQTHELWPEEKSIEFDHKWLEAAKRQKETPE